MNPENDGIDHINVYSKGKTELGKFLSNFAYSLIETEDGLFSSIEGYWYWLGHNDDRLRKLSGFEAKKLGRELGAPDWIDSEEFKEKIKKAITIKLNSNEAVELLDANSDLLDLPLAHYYVYKGKVVEPKDGEWILEHLKNVINGETQ